MGIKGNHIHWQMLQDDVSEWANKQFPNSTLKGKLEHVKEELDEILAEPTDRFEWADVLLIFLHAAKDHGMNIDNLYEACTEKFAIVKKRNWQEPDANGVTRHVKCDK